MWKIVDKRDGTLAAEAPTESAAWRAVLIIAEEARRPPILFGVVPPPHVHLPKF